MCTNFDAKDGERRLLYGTQKTLLRFIGKRPTWIPYGRDILWNICILCVYDVSHLQTNWEIQRKLSIWTTSHHLLRWLSHPSQCSFFATMERTKYLNPLEKTPEIQITCPLSLHSPNARLIESEFSYNELEALLQHCFMNDISDLYCIHSVLLPY